MSLFDVYPSGTLNIGTTNATTINIGASTSLINIKGTINYAEQGKISSASSPILAITGTLTFVKTYSVAPLVLLTVDMGSGTVIVSCALAGVSTTTFNYILSSLSGVSSLNYYVVVI